MYEPQFHRDRLDIDYIIEHTIGRKWTLTILRLIRDGTNRPGAMARSATGLSTKVLNKRLSVLVELGIIKKNVFLEIPPHVEYVFTNFGLKFIKILEVIDELEKAR